MGSCDDNVDLSYTVVELEVTHVTVDGIALPACAGAQLSITVVDGFGSALASGGPVTVGQTSITVPVSPAADAELVDGAHVLLVGP